MAFEDITYLPADTAMTVYLRLLTEQAEEKLASHAALVDGLDRTIRSVNAQPEAPRRSSVMRRIRRFYGSTRMVRKVDRWTADRLIMSSLRMAAPEPLASL